MLKKILLWVSTFSGILMLVWVIIVLDVTSMPITRISAPDAFSREYQQKDSVVLLSYADGDNVYFKNQNALNLSALNRGVDHLHTYRRSHINPTFFEQYKHILNQKRGAGYWLWKPYIILQTMKMYPENTLIIYADSGVIFSKDISLLFMDLKSHDRIFVIQGKSTPLERHLKKEAQHKMGISDDSVILKSENLWAFFMCFKNTKENQAFVEQWLKLCCDGSLLTDAPMDPKRQNNAFEYHQHDQSLLSVILAKQDAVFLGKTQLIKKNVLRNRYGIYNIHRHPKDEWTSPWFIMGGMPAWLNAVLLNNPLMRMLRKIREF